MAEAKKYPRLFALPRPKLGDQMYRRTLVNQYEEAIVTSLIGNEPGSENWTATLMTKNGVEFVSGDVEHRGVHNWMPRGWEYDKDNATWTVPAELLRAGDAVDEDPAAAIQEASTDVFVLPQPWEDEKFMSWKSRAVKSVPALRQHMRSSALLSDAWKNKEYEVRL